MGYCIHEKSIKAAAKQHACEWCGDLIREGDAYKSYRWVDGRDALTVKMHHECNLASIEEMKELGVSEIEIVTGNNFRGCCCQRDPNCECRPAQRSGANYE